MILVIGSKGQVATCLRKVALQKKIDVVALGRPQVDLSVPESISDVLRDRAPTAVINAAAYTAVDQAEAESKLAFAVNSEGAGHLAEMCREHEIPLIHLSTDYVFDGSKREPYVETDPVNPINVYGRSKLEGELRVAQAQPEHLILRTSWIYSPYGRNFLKSMIRLGSTEPSLRIVDDQIGCPTYAQHLAEVVLQLAMRVATGGAGISWGIYHAAGSGSTSWYGMAQMIFAYAASAGFPKPELMPIRLADLEMPAQRPLNSRLDCAKLQREANITLPDWQTGVADCVQRLLVSRDEVTVR